MTSCYKTVLFKIVQLAMIHPEAVVFPLEDQANSP